MFVTDYYDYELHGRSERVFEEADYTYGCGVYTVVYYEEYGRGRGKVRFFSLTCNLVLSLTVLFRILSRHTASRVTKPQKHANGTHQS